MRTNRRFKFTDAALKKLPPPSATGLELYYDKEVDGLVLRINRQNTRTFALRYRTKQGTERYIRIGNFSTTSTPDWTVSGARRKASEWKGDIQLGHDPQEEAQAERDARTVQDMIDRFVDENFPALRPATREDYANLIAHDFPPLARKKLKQLSFSDVDGWFRKLSKRAPIRANLAHSVLRRMLGLATNKWGWLEKNVAIGIDKNPAQKRQRYLTKAEVARLLVALDKNEDVQGCNVLKLLLLTGARRGEVQGAKWAHINLSDNIWTKPHALTKQRKESRIPLSGDACQLLASIKNDSEWVFPAVKSASGHREEIQKTWYEVCAAAKITGARIHDLRHTYASVLASGGVALYTIGNLLGHSSPQTTARYSHLVDDHLRAATETASAILTGKPSAEIVPLRGTVK